jgi:hypothetical protein
MSKWAADFANDPSNDFEFMVEILYDDKDVAVIRRGEEGLELKWYANKKDLVIPLDWISETFIEAKKRLIKNKICLKELHKMPKQ